MITRKNFGKAGEWLELPNLVEIQTGSYAEFLQADTPRTRRKPQGLQEAFLEVFPIESLDRQTRVEFVSYTLGEPKYALEECRDRGQTFASPLRVQLRLVTREEAREQEVYMGDLPLMTETGTFIINGDERVIVSQLHRSPGVSFEETVHPNGKRLHSARIIPARGAWVEIEFDLNGLLHAYIDRRRKFLVTTLLRAVGYATDREILELFCGVETVKLSGGLRELVGRALASAVTFASSGEILARAGDKITRETLERFQKQGVTSVEVVKTEVPELLATLQKDHNRTQEEALLDIYRRLRPGDPPTHDSAKGLLERLFFDPRRYDLSRVGRFILNRRLTMQVPLTERILTRETLVAVVRYVIGLKRGEGHVDDIDHLGNRRVRTVGELLESQVRIGLARLERSVRERMSMYSAEHMMPHNLINSKLISSVIRDFFGRSQLSQFMDQTNPLAELTHKRRLSALGPGGLSRERAGFEVRDVHHSHYGRICPIETPEGPNIGLIASLSTFARVNEYGLLDTPYRKVEHGRVTHKIEYLTADLEEQAIIAQANAKLDGHGRFLEPLVSCRHRGDFPQVKPEQVQYMDVSPRQLVSIAASLIPFLEHDDANRALMGSNMQRQAVPLLETEVALIGTGMEFRIAKDSGALVVAKHAGRVRAVQSDEVVVGHVRYPLRKFQRSNANTCINQRPIVKLGQRIQPGDILADGAGTKDGELALGRNVLVAFMPWRGYNFEDAILVSERLLKEDFYTSVHIEEFEIEARDTRLGDEDITADIPNVGEEALKNLDEHGIVRIGAEVQPGDILVGKVTPKSETELSPEERLLRAIFGEKAGDVRDASLTVPPGVEGIIVGVKVFSRKVAKPKDKEELQQEQQELARIQERYEGELATIQEAKRKALNRLLVGRAFPSMLKVEGGAEIRLPRRSAVRVGDLKRLQQTDLRAVSTPDEPKMERQLRRLGLLFDSRVEALTYDRERELDALKRGDELPPGVLKKVLVHVASKKRLSVGDKMAGRHGNKGVIAKILREEDMPFLLDGTPVDIVLNPLGVPSRMNLGQLLETHLGWAAQRLGVHLSSPVFDGASEDEIRKEMQRAGLPLTGKTVLHDGLTGDAFDQEVTVGYIYMMKLAHLVDDKIHARSIGPYSLVTQQPLGGKAQFGGQRFGEMEVWALEAYGAAYTLQELLTVKSDDVVGRTRVYEAIVKGENALHPGTPESFNVLVKELQSLGLDVKLERKAGAAVDLSSQVAQVRRFLTEGQKVTTP